MYSKPQLTLCFSKNQSKINGIRNKTEPLEMTKNDVTMIIKLQYGSDNLNLNVYAANETVIGSKLQTPN